MENKNKAEKMRERCGNCSCLIEGDNGEWVCGEIEIPCIEIKDCANWENEQDGEI